VKFQISFFARKLRNLKFPIFDRVFVFLLAIIILAVILRFYKLNTNPPGLYWDEAAFGYDAYSILKTGKDHHGVFLPLFFESFGDWKLPVYHYLLVPSIAAFGLNEFAVRFPSALLGTLTVLLTYFLTKKLFSQVPDTSYQSGVSRPGQQLKTDKPTPGIWPPKPDTLALLSAFFLAISPWHLQFSRGGFESTVGLFFVIVGVYLFLLGLERQKILLFTFSFLLLTFSMYTYHAYRIFTPLFALCLAFIYFGQIKQSLAKLILPLALSILLLLPLLIFTFSKQGKARAISQSAFKKEEVEVARIDYDQKSKKPLRSLSKYLYPTPLYYSYIASNAYLNHFSAVFLFFQGDSIGRHSQVDMGQIYLFEALLLMVSIFAFKNLNTKSAKLMLAWLLISPVPATIVTPTPHAYRTLQMVIPLAFFSGLGAYSLFSRRFKFPLKFLVAVAFLYSFLTYLHLAFIHYPKKFAADWQDGNRQMVRQIQKYQANFDKIYVTDINQVPYIYLLFYQKYDPRKFIENKGTKNGFDKYIFISDDIDIYNKGKILYVAPSWKKVDGKWLAAADDSTRRHIYSLWEVGGQN